LTWLPLVQSNEKSGQKVAVAPSLLAADFSRLADEIRSVESAGADLLHLDVMDGHFVPNLTFGPFVVGAVRRLTSLTLDTHLMIENPDRFIERFIDNGSDVVTIHVEASSDVRRDLGTIKDRGKKCGLSLNPDTPLDRAVEYFDLIDLFLVMSVFPGFGGQSFISGVLEKVAETREIRDKKGLHFAIEIDGGINAETAADARGAGVDVLVAGTAIFKSGDYAKTIRALRHAE